MRMRTCARCERSYFSDDHNLPNRCKTVSPYYLGTEKLEHFANECPRVVSFNQFGNTSDLLFWTDRILLEKETSKVFEVLSGEVDGAKMVLRRAGDSYEVRPPIDQKSGSKASITVTCLRPPADFRAVLVSKVAAMTKVRDLMRAFENAEG